MIMAENIILSVLWSFAEVYAKAGNPKDFSGLTGYVDVAVSSDDGVILYGRQSQQNSDWIVDAALACGNTKALLEQGMIFFLLAS